MRIIDILATANRNLLRSKLRTFLTISAIFVGAFTLTLTTALGAGAQQYLDRQLGNVTAPGIFYVAPKTSLNPFASSSEPAEYNPNKPTASGLGDLSLSQADVDNLRAIDGVKTAKPYLTPNAEYVTRGGNAKKFVSPSLAQYTGLSLDLSAGRLLKQDDATSVILPDNYVTPLGFADVNDAIGKTVQIAYKNVRGQQTIKTLTVVGVMKKTFVTLGQMYLDDASVAEVAKAQGQDQRFFAVVVQFGDTSIDETVLRDRLKAAGDYTVTSLKERIGTLTTIITAITTGLDVVGGIALFAASFGIINTLLMSVYERTQEIGLMKALGIHRGSVFLLFALEAVLVGFWGSAIATVVGWLAAQGIDGWASQSFLKDFQGFTLLVVTPLNAAIVVAIIMLIAFLAGTLPAIKASKLNPIEALRSE